MRQIQDHYFKLAKQHGYVARSYFKLQDIDKKYNFVRKNMKVIDLGCTPGAWMQYIQNKTGFKANIFGVDLNPHKLQNTKSINFIQGDIQDESVIEKLVNLTGGPADLILSDMAPKTSGIKDKDSYLSYELGLTVLETANKLLVNKGNIVCKNLEGEDTSDLIKEFKKCFRKVKVFKPESSRKESKEIFLIGFEFKGEQTDVRQSKEIIN